MKRIVATLLKNWFLIGLIVLALCAIPGIVLVILALCGMDSQVNAWLLDTWQITYQLTLPPLVTLILLLLPFLLVLLYFLKLKRKPVQVPSTFLWKKSIEDLHVNSLFQWLRDNVLLLLQLLVLLFLIYSVLGLRFHGSTSRIRNYILLIDNSASMSAKDVAPSRLDWAKQEALKEIDAAHGDDFGMVIVFNSKATILQTYTNDKVKLREAVNSIQPTQRPTRIEEALALANSLANPVRSTEDLSVQPDNVREDQLRTMVSTQGKSTLVHFYSDGRFPKLSDATLANLNSSLPGNGSALGNLNLRYHMAGKITKAGNTDNLAIVGLNVLRQPLPGPKNVKNPPHLLLAFVQLANYRESAAEVKLKLDIYVDGAMAHPMQQTLQIPPRKYEPAQGELEERDEPGETGVKFTLPSIEPHRHVVLHAYLDKPNDEFPLDDQAWLVLGTTRKAQVLIVGPANPILDAFFEQEATRKIAISQRMTPADLPTEAYRKKARSGEVDLILFDRSRPETEADMPLANTFFIDQPPPPWQRGKTLLKDALFISSKQGHPLLRYLSTISDVGTSEAFAFDPQKNLDPKLAELALPPEEGKKRTLPTLTRIIETTNHLPLVFTLARGSYTDLVMAFSIYPLRTEVDWPLKVSFPIFLRNVIYTLGNVEDSVRAISVQAGEPVVLRPDAGFTRLKVTTPTKQTHQFVRAQKNEILFTDTDHVGVYTYVVDPGNDEKGKNEMQRGFAVNLLDVNESNIEPRKDIHIGNERITAGEEKMQPRDIWKWILVLTVILLLAEWFIYHRRIAV